MKRASWAIFAGGIAVGGGLLVARQAVRAARSKPIDSAELVQALIATKQPASAVEAVKQAAARADACQYAEVAGRAGLDADLHALVMHILELAPASCPHAALLTGQRAEALARAGETNQAEMVAMSTLSQAPANQYADFALARTAYDKNQMTSCSDYASKALKYGRGAEAERLLGRSALARGLFKEADQHYQAVLLATPNDAEAAFSSGVCNDKLGRYTPAREAFLQTLRIDPKHQQARVYLVMLTHNAGADAEARHHLAKLGELIPKDSAQYLQLAQLLDGNSADGGAPDAGAIKPLPGFVQGKRH